MDFFFWLLSPANSQGEMEQGQVGLKASGLGSIL